MITPAVREVGAEGLRFPFQPVTFRVALPVSRAFGEYLLYYQVNNQEEFPGSPRH